MQSAFSLFPARVPFRTTIDKRSIAECLASDWKMVGMDLERALKSVKSKTF
jgi:hypothetical protein